MSEIQVNTINEYTGASGVTIDGLLIKDGAIPSISGGKVLQVVQATYSTQGTSTSTSFTDTGLTASITPSNASNKVLVQVLSKRGWLKYGLSLLNQNVGFRQGFVPIDFSAPEK